MPPPCTRAESSPAGKARLSSGASGRPGSSRSCHGSCRGPEKSRVLPGPGERPLDQPQRQRHTVRNTIPPPPDEVDNRRIARKVVARRNPIQVGRPARIRHLAGQHPMHGRQVISLGMRHRADDRQLLRSCRQPRQVLAHPDPGDRRINRLELAANPLRRLGLHVKRIVLPQPPAQQDHDDRPRPPAVAPRRQPASRAASNRGSPSPRRPE